MLEVAHSLVHERNIIFEARLNMVPLNLHAANLLEVHLTFLSSLKLFVQGSECGGVNDWSHVALLEIVSDCASSLKFLRGLVGLCNGLVVVSADELSSEILNRERVL